MVMIIISPVVSKANLPTSSLKNDIDLFIIPNIIRVCRGARSRAAGSYVAWYTTATADNAAPPRPRGDQAGEPGDGFMRQGAERSWVSDRSETAAAHVTNGPTCRLRPDKRILARPFFSRYLLLRPR